MGTSERRAKRRIWQTVAIMAATVLLTLSLGGAAVAKKKHVFKTGTYMGATDDLEPIGFIVKKKQVTGLFVDLPRCPGDPGTDGGPPGFAGLQAPIDVKKVGSIAFEPGKHKRVGKFEAKHPYGEVDGYIKGKKAEGFGFADTPCERSFEWAAERTGPLPPGS